MTAPVIGFTAEVPNGLLGETYIVIEPIDDAVEITLELVGRHDQDDYRSVIITHDEARQIIAGLASVIT